ncbi:MAG: ACP S-malonyltransferase [Myxococcota bacterium]
MVFPGQGSQSVGMQSGLAEIDASVRQTYTEASEALDYDLWQLVQSGPADELDATEVTQPAMLTAGVAAWRVWHSRGGATPDFMAGHSLGEYTALVAAGALAFTDAVRLVRLRGQLMQNAVAPGEGAMAAIIGLDDDAVLDVCTEATAAGVAEAVNFNSPGQVVISGSRSGVEKAVELAQAAGARRAILLAVSVPSHSSLMQGAGAELAAALADTAFVDPTTSVVSSVAMRPYTDAADMRQLLTAQVSSPVQWVKTVQAMTAAGADTLIECGPGKVLSGLIRRIDKSLQTGIIDDAASLEKALGLDA